MPQQSHRKGREREPGKGGTEQRETGAEGGEERKGRGGEERTGGNTKQSGGAAGKVVQRRARGKKKNGNTRANAEDKKESIQI